MADLNDLTMSQEAFEAALTELCDRIYDLTLKGRGVVTVKDVQTFDRLALGVYYAVHRTADALMTEIEAHPHTKEVECGS